MEPPKKITKMENELNETLVKKLPTKKKTEMKNYSSRNVCA